jgi:hypothetical protein
MISAKTLESIPNFLPRVIASLTAIISIARAILLQALAIYPAPSFLQLIIFFPIN